MASFQTQKVIGKMEKYNNLTWDEGNLWYGWVYNEKENRYYFNDTGYESMMDLWEYFWSREEDVKENQM